MKNKIQFQRLFILALLTLISHVPYAQGFNNIPVSWSTPYYFDKTSGIGSGIRYTTMDIDGDSKPDLVATYDNGAIGSAGNYSWNVYLNNGSGFDSSPISWSTPDYFVKTSDFGGSVKYTTMDIDGDSKPDLVETYDNGVIGSAGNYSWNVYLNLSTVSVEDLNHSSDKLKIFPNPTNDIFNIDLSEMSISTIAIYNYTGQIVHQERDVKSNSFSFDLSNFFSGIYYLRLESYGNVTTFKIIKK